jgi:hypothetical protein
MSICCAIKAPAFLEARQFTSSLIPSDARRVGQFPKAAMARAKPQIMPQIAAPAQQLGS